MLGALVQSKVGTEHSAGGPGPERGLWCGGAVELAGSPGVPTFPPSPPPLHAVVVAFPLPACRKPDIPVPYLYFDMGAAVLCASFMSFGVKRRWFALGAALQLAVSTYAAYVGGYVHYGDWLKVSASAPGGLR